MLTLDKKDVIRNIFEFNDFNYNLKFHKKRGAPCETPLLHHSSINNQTFLISNKLLFEIV
jgi:hypothetical protein